VTAQPIDDIAYRRLSEVAGTTHADSEVGINDCIWKVLMKPANNTSSPTPTVPRPMAWAGPATPDRRLATLFTRRSTTEPATASSVGILSTYPPTQCGVATFTESLTAALIAGAPSTTVGIVRVGAVQPSDHNQQVVYDLSPGTVDDSREAARMLNTFDVAVIQHEYGIYSGADGEQVLDILECLEVPIVVVVHTVLSQPTAHQRFVLETLTQCADAVVTMSHAGRQRLLDEYRVEPRKLLLIPHGASVVDGVARVAPGPRRPMVLTWGLLGPGKGIEWGIEALSRMSLLRPRPRYVVAGQTHPKVLAYAGESYREFLAQRAESQGVRHLVEFQPGFISPARLQELLREADVVLLPYDSHDQVTSGVLTEAMAAKAPVVSTSFPHAVELLSDGLGGTLVPHKEPGAMAAALTKILVEPGVAASMSAHNATLTNLVSWPTVAGQYRQLFSAVVRRTSAPGR
jgi:glycosyltransferase involved in cell wall biosynthesis